MSLSHIVIVPIKSHSERIPNKNFTLLQGKPLYQHFLSTLKVADVFTKIVVDTDSEEIHKWCKSADIDTLVRIPEHTLATANGNTLLRHHVKLFPFEYNCYWQGFVTAPYITPDTVKTMVSTLESNLTTYDSIMSVKAHYGFFWSNAGQPLSYRPEVMPRSQDLAPIYQEICGLFGVTRAGFASTQTRAGTKPYFYVLPEKECVDIDWPSDLKLEYRPEETKTHVHKFNMDLLDL